MTVCRCSLDANSGDGTATLIDPGARHILGSTTIFGWDAAGDVLWRPGATRDPG